MEPQNRQLNIEEKWYGYESSGRYSGEPAVYLYYGDEGVNTNYKVSSLSAEMNGWKWTNKISNHNAHIVFTAEDGVNPLDYGPEIADFLTVQRHNTARLQVPYGQIPSDETDASVDHYSVIIPNGEFREMGDNEEAMEWYVNEHRRRDRVDFIFGFDGLLKNRDHLSRISREYLIDDERIWLYPEDFSDFEKLLTVLKATGNRVTLPPQIYRRLSNGDIRVGYNKDEGREENSD